MAFQAGAIAIIADFDIAAKERNVDTAQNALGGEILHGLVPCSAYFCIMRPYVRILLFVMSVRYSPAKNFFSATSSVIASWAVTKL